MQTFAQSLVELFNAGWISFEAGAERCSKAGNFKSYTEGHYPDIDMGILSN